MKNCSSGVTPTDGRFVLVDVSEEAFRCYPLRGDSLSFYSQPAAVDRAGMVVAVDVYRLPGEHGSILTTHPRARDAVRLPMRVAVPAT